MPRVYGRLFRLDWVIQLARRMRVLLELGRLYFHNWAIAYRANPLFRNDSHVAHGLHRLTKTRQDAFVVAYAAFYEVVFDLDGQLPRDAMYGQKCSGVIVGSRSVASVVIDPPVWVFWVVSSNFWCQQVIGVVVKARKERAPFAREIHVAFDEPGVLDVLMSSEPANLCRLRRGTVYAAERTVALVGIVLFFFFLRYIYCFLCSLV